MYVSRCGSRIAPSVTTARGFLLIDGWPRRPRNAQGFWPRSRLDSTSKRNEPSRPPSAVVYSDLWSRIVIWRLRKTSLRSGERVLLATMETPNTELRMTAQYFYVVVAEPRGNYPGRIEEGWFIFDGGKVVLTDIHGAPMIGDYRATPHPSEP